MMRSLSLILIFSACILMQASATEISQTIRVGNVSRSYQLFQPSKPSAAPMPLVLVFHGGGGNAEAMSKKTDFNQYAERDGVFVAYLQGDKKHWNDGRELSDSRADDIGFVKALIAKLEKEKHIDSQRIFAVGHSNGAIFTQSLALAIASQLHAIAAVSGPVSASEVISFKPAKPLSVMLIHGTQDPVVPYEGGPVAKTRGEVASVKATVSLWRKADNMSVIAKKLPYNDPDKNDACTVMHEQWQSEHHRVELVTLYGAGHDWPAIEQATNGPLRNALKNKILGPACTSFSASEAIWRFFFNP
jgi:polyhydroxybutyrate depolymerase